MLLIKIGSLSIKASTGFNSTPMSRCNDSGAVSRYPVVLKRAKSRHRLHCSESSLRFEMQPTEVTSRLFLAATHRGLHLIATPLLLAQHLHRVFAQDCCAQLQRRSLNGVEEVLKKRCVHVVVVHVPKQCINREERLGNDRYDSHCKSVIRRLGNPDQGP